MTPASRRRTAVRLLAPLVALGLVATACNDDDGTTATVDTQDQSLPPATDTRTTNPPVGTEPPPGGPTIRVRGQDFSESITIAEVYGQFLEARGYNVEIQAPAGFRTEALASLDNADIDLVIDYIGGTLTALAPDEPTSADPDEIMPIISSRLGDMNLTLLDYSPAVDGDALVVRGDSEATTVSDLDGLDYVFGASAQCFERPQCYIGLTDPDIYGIEFADTVTLEFGPLLGEALSAGEVDAVFWNTTAPQITEQDFRVLEDDQGLFPAQNIAPIIRNELLVSYGDQLADDLNELSAMITTDDLLAWNTETDIEFRESRDVATEWLQSKGLI
jgi:osmoprotectant transport system substrate-binding protein